MSQKEGTCRALEFRQSLRRCHSRAINFVTSIYKLFHPTSPHGPPAPPPNSPPQSPAKPPHNVPPFRPQLAPVKWDLMENPSTLKNHLFQPPSTAYPSPSPLRKPRSLSLSSSKIPTPRKHKQVRFVYTNTFQSPAVSPALTFASSLQSSPGPITPPQTSHSLPGPFPYTISYGPQFPSKPPHHAGPLRPHRLLESEAVKWDLMENPSTITLKNHPLSSRLLVEMATTPPLPAFSITSMHLPWTINVHASNGSYVTLEDFFESVYRSLRTNITANEFNLLSHQKDQKRATRAYEQRYRRFRSTSAHDSEKRGGMKRVDFLMGCTTFQNISNTSQRSDEWRLNVS